MSVPALEMADSNETATLSSSLCTSDDRNIEPHGKNPVGIELGDEREPLAPSPAEGSIVPVLTAPTEEKSGTGAVSGMILPSNTIGVRVLLKEVNCLAHRVEVVEAVIEPLRRACEAATVGSLSSTQSVHIVDMSPELKQSIRESTELIRSINSNFSRLDEKLNEWVPTKVSYTYIYYIIMCIHA